MQKMSTVHPTDDPEPNHINGENGTITRNDSELSGSVDNDEDDVNPELSQELIFQCARNGDVDKLRSILNTSTEDINEDDDDHMTALHYAARYNRLAVVELLLDSGADVDARDDNGRTPLHYACRIKRKRKKGNKSRLGLFGDDEAIDSEDWGESQSLSPHQSTDTDVIRALVNKDPAALTETDNRGLTALHHAALRGDELACETLLSLDNQLVLTKDKQEMTPLHKAACKGESDIVRQLIKAGASVFDTDEDKSTPLHEAASEGCTKTAKIIFDACNAVQVRSLLEATDEDGNTPFMRAVRSRKYKFARMCIKKGSATNTQNKYQMTELHLAAMNDDENIVRLLLKNKASVSIVDSDHQTPLHLAAMFDNTEAIELLLQYGAYLEARDLDEFTPLLIAISYGCEKAVETLINKKADVRVEDKNHKTAIYIAADKGNLKALQMLLECPEVKDMVNDKDEKGNSPLHTAATSGHVPIVKCLIDNGADLYSKNDEDATPIHCAAQNGWTDVVKEIVKKEKNTLSERDEYSTTPLHLAATGGHTELVEALLNLGAYVGVRNSLSRTPLGCAAQAGCIKVVRLLSEHHAVIDPVDREKMTPLLLAAEYGHPECVSFLIEQGADVTKRDEDGNNCLDLAIFYDHADVALEVIKSESWKDALRNLEEVDKHPVDTPLRKLIRKMPEVAEKVFDKSIEENELEEGSQSKRVYDFEFLDDLYQIPRWKHDIEHPRKKTETNQGLTAYTNDSDNFKRNHPLMIMVNSSREELLTHDLCKALLDYKWTSFGCIFYYAMFGSYLIFLFFLTSYVIVMDPPYKVANENLDAFPGDSVCQRYKSSGAKQHTLAAIGHFVILILAFVNIIREILQAFLLKYAYITFENFLECTLFVSAVLFTLHFEDCQKDTGYRTDWQWYFGTIAVFLAWIELVLFIQKFTALGIYVVMFKYILYTFCKFALVFLLFIIAFGMGFYCLIQNQTPYQNPWLAIMRTTVMMTGEFGYNSIFHGDDDVNYWFTYVFMCVFVVIMSIIIMNLLIGLAVDDIKGIQEQAQLMRIAMRVNLILDIERILLKFTSLSYKPKHDVVFETAKKPNKEIHQKKEIEDQMKASQKKVLKKVDKIKHTVKSLKKDNTRIEKMIEAILRAQNIVVDQDD